MADSHWEKSYKQAIRQAEVEGKDIEAPELTDADIEEMTQKALIDEIIKATDGYNDAERAAAGVERQEQAKAESEARSQQAAADREEARAEGITIDEVRRRRHEEAKAGDEAGDEQVEAPVEAPAEAAQDEGEQTVVALLAAIATDLAAIKDSLGGEGEPHG
jgi:hypothetical protein